MIEKLKTTSKNWYWLAGNFFLQSGKVGFFNILRSKVLVH